MSYALIQYQWRDQYLCLLDRPANTDSTAPSLCYYYIFLTDFETPTTAKSMGVARKFRLWRTDDIISGADPETGHGGLNLGSSIQKTPKNQPKLR